MVEKEVAHLPERSLVGGRLRRVRDELRVGVDVVERQVPHTLRVDLDAAFGGSLRMA